VASVPSWYRIASDPGVLRRAALTSLGVGTILTQWLKHLGCLVIGTAGGAEKVKLAKAHGCDHPILYTRENFLEREVP